MLLEPDLARLVQSAAPTPRRSGQWLQLLTALLELAGGKAELVSHAERTWASATFSGTRHTIRLDFSGADAIAAGEALIDAVAEHEFALPRQIVADASVVAVEHTTLPQPVMAVEIVLLLLDDC